MGVRIVAKGVDSEAFATEFSAAVRRGLEGIFFTNTDLSKIAKNYAPGKPSGTVVGAPTPGANSCVMKGVTNYVQTQIAETPEATFLVVCKRIADAAAGQPIYYGNYNTGTVSGISLYSPSAGRHSGTAGFGNDDPTNLNVTATVTPIDEYSFGLYSVTVSATKVSTKSHTANISSESAVQASPRRPSTRLLRIGSSYSAGLNGPNEIAAVFHYSVALTADELAKAATDIRNYCARKGITV